VRDGDTYVRELYQTQEAVLKRNFNLSRAEKRNAMAGWARYGCSDTLFDELRSIDCESWSRIPEGVLHIVQSSYPDVMPSTREVTWDVVDYSCNWESLHDDIILPQPIVERLIDRVTAS
jgi:hypothetical protein